MKKLFLAILAIGAVNFANAQAGSVLVYGDVGISSDKMTFDDGVPGTDDLETKITRWNFSPGVGYQFNRNWTVGLNFSIGGAKQTFSPEDLSDPNEIKMMDLAIGPFIRMTMPINKTFCIWHQLNLSYLNGSETFEHPSPAPEEKNTYNGFGASWGPAVGVNFTECMALNFGFGQLGFTQRTWDNEGTSENKESSFVFDWGSQFHIGVSANLGGHHKKKGYREPMDDSRKMDMSDDDSE